MSWSARSTSWAADQRQIVQVGDGLQLQGKLPELIGVALVTRAHRFGHLGERDQQFFNLASFPFEIFGGASAPLIQLLR
jgi:hypothetical protein